MIATLDQLALRVHGEVVGDGSREIDGAAALHKAGPRDIAYAGDERHLRALNMSRAGGCLIGRRFFDPKFAVESNPALVLVDDPQEAFIVLLRDFRPQPSRPDIGVSPDARIDATGTIGANCNVYPGAYIDAGAIIGARCDIYPGAYVGRNCRIGDDCVLHPNAVLYADVVLQDRVVIHAGAVLGADGFGYRFQQGRFEKIPQLGWVEVHDDCEIGAGATIDRGMIGPTVIGAGTKLDNQVMIGHNCELGKHNAFASQVGLAGSVTTGDYVRCAGQVGVADHVHLGTGCTLGAKAGAHKDIPPGETHVGLPARPEQEQLRIVMATGKVPEMRKQLRVLENRMNELTQQIEQLINPVIEA